jgi:cation transport ATPase
MLTNLIQRIKTVDGRLWKWLLSLAIFAGSLYVAWWLRKKKQEYDQAQLDKQFEEQRAVLARDKAASEKSQAMADMFRQEAKAHVAQVQKNNAKVIVLTGEIAKAQTELDAVKTWQELTARAKGERI